MEGIKTVIEFFSDKSKSIGLKTAMFISTLVILLIIDLSIDFTYDMTVNSKIEQLSKIYKLKSLYQNDTNKMNLLIKLESEIFQKTHYSKWFDASFFSSDKNIKTIEKEGVVVGKETETSKNIVFSKIWMTLTSSFSFWVMWPLLILLPLYQKKKQKGFFFGWLALNTVWASLIVMTTVIAYQIPLVFNNPTFNYILNFIIHVLLIGFTTYLINKEK